MAKVSEVTSEVQQYLDMFSQYEKEFAKWEGRVDKILKRYRDDRTTTTAQSHYNILWANVQTLKALPLAVCLSLMYLVGLRIMTL